MVRKTVVAVALRGELMKKIIALALFGGALALSGCVNSSTSMLDTRTAVISGRGSAFTGMGSVTQSILREAAEQATKRGYTHFVILNSQNQTSTAYVREPSNSYTTGSATANCFGGSCFGNYSGSTHTTGGNVYGFEKPGADMIVRFLNADEAGPDAWSAQDVLAASEKAEAPAP